MTVIYILGVIIICIIGYAFLWVSIGVLLSLFTKKFDDQDENKMEDEQKEQ